jgi:ankyrin repeat protein
MRFAVPLAFMLAVMAAYLAWQSERDSGLAYRYLFEACERGDRATVVRMLATGASPNHRDEHGMTPLGLAVRAGSVDLVRALVNAGADVSAPASV